MIVRIVPRKIDPILVILCIIACVIMFNYATRVINSINYSESTKEKKELELNSVNKICVDNGKLMECNEIEPTIYRIIMYKEDDLANSHTVLFTRK